MDGIKKIQAVIVGVFAGITGWLGNLAIPVYDECINDSKVILDVEPYTYQDYLSDRYEMERHDDTKN